MAEVINFQLNGVLGALPTTCRREKNEERLLLLLLILSLPFNCVNVGSATRELIRETRAAGKATLTGEEVSHGRPTIKSAAL